MQIRSAIRELVLVGMAVTVGWWLRGAGTSVFAQRSSSTPARGGSSSGETPLGFQMSGIGREMGLTIYNPGNRTLYVYPGIGSGNSYVACEYSFTISAPGAPIQRENCPVGELFPQH